MTATIVAAAAIIETVIVNAQPGADVEDVHVAASTAPAPLNAKIGTISV
jgi:hypothetical protein